MSFVWPYKKKRYSFSFTNAPVAFRLRVYGLLFLKGSGETKVNHTVYCKLVAEPYTVNDGSMLPNDD